MPGGSGLLAVNSSRPGTAGSAQLGTGASASGAMKTTDPLSTLSRGAALEKSAPTLCLTPQALDATASSLDRQI